MGISGGAPPLGSVIAGKYRIERVIGRGGMGVVVEAMHLQLELPVAIKFLLPEMTTLSGAAARFLREARAASRIRSEHVARVLDTDALSDGTPFLVMEYLTGHDLHQVLRMRGALPVAEAIDFVLQACEALAEAHALGIVHRDLKPGNLFLTQRLDGTPLVKLLDFGIAKAPETQAWTEGSLTMTRGTLGSPMYMSPEQLRDTSSVDLRTDIWALGVILYELITGRNPFAATSAASLGALIATGSPASLDAFFDEPPKGLDAVLRRCLEKSASERYSTVGELAMALRPFSADRSRASLDRIASVSAVTGASATVLAVPKTSAPPPPLTRRTDSGPRTLTSPTDNFRRQHEELARLGGELLQRFAAPPDETAKNASELRRMMARFAGKLSVHASMENEALYPRLLEHRDVAVRSKAKELFDEVKNIYSAFGSFTKRWPTTASIEADPATYAKDSKKVLKTLWMRMVRENDELYPLVDEAG
jgi:serine/threonine protein kinase